MSNKRFMLVLSIVLVLALALTACAAPAAAPAVAPGAGATVAAPAEGGAAATDKLEVFSWWTSGGEAAALQALFDAYAAR